MAQFAARGYCGTLCLGSYQQGRKARQNRTLMGLGPLTDASLAEAAKKRATAASNGRVTSAETDITRAGARWRSGMKKQGLPAKQRNVSA
jgi:hypothetical protein